MLRLLHNCFQRNLYSIYIKPFYSLQSGYTSTVHTIAPKNLWNNKQISNLYMVKRLKHKKNKSEEINIQYEDISEDDLSDQIEPYEKLHSRTVPSLRLDTVLKSSLGVGRSKIDTDFYESKIRINGEKVFKKSVEVHNGDEIDVFVDVSPDNPNFIIVNRVKIIATSILQNNFKVSFVRYKSLVIEDYR